MKGELVTAAICEKYGWTLQEFDSQPWDFLKVVIEKYKIEKQKEEQAAKQVPRRT